jgi:hypothetical protein
VKTKLQTQRFRMHEKTHFVCAAFPTEVYFNQFFGFLSILTSWLENFNNLLFMSSSQARVSAEAEPFPAPAADIGSSQWHGHSY